MTHMTFRIVCIALGICQCFLLFFCPSSFASNNLVADDVSDTALVVWFHPKIIVTARRIPEDPARTSSNVTVIDTQALERTPAHDVGEILEEIPGVVIQKIGGTGRAVSVHIQGSQSRHVRVMIDGIPLNNQSSGQANPSVFSLENIDRIEIVKGGASSVWGSSLGGVINIITKPVGEEVHPHGTASVTMGEFDTHKYTLDFNGEVFNHGYFFSGNFYESDGFRTKGDLETQKGYGKIEVLDTDRVNLTTSLGYTETDSNDFQFPGFGISQAQDHKAIYSSTQMKYMATDRVDIDLNLKYLDQELQSQVFLINNPVPVQVVDSQDKYYGVDIVGSMILSNDSILVVGADISTNELESSFLTTDRDVFNWAPYANYNIFWHDWEFTLGLRYDNSSEFGDQLSPYIGGVYHVPIWEDTVLRVNVSRAFNAPPLLFKYLTGFGVVANPDLDAERAWLYQVGMETKLTELLWAKVTLYYAEIDDAIDLAINNLGQQFQKNFREFTRKGVEAELRYWILDGLSVHGGAAFNDVRNEETDRIVHGRPRTTFDVGLDYTHEDMGLDVNIDGRYIWWNMDSVNQPRDKKFIWNARISKRLREVGSGDLSAFVAGYNLTDSETWHNFLFPHPGRYFEGGLTYTF